MSKEKGGGKHLGGEGFIARGGGQIVSHLEGGGRVAPFKRRGIRRGKKRFLEGGGIKGGSCRGTQAEGAPKRPSGLWSGSEGGKLQRGQDSNGWPGENHLIMSDRLAKRGGRGKENFASAQPARKIEAIIVLEENDNEATARRG